MKKAQISVEFIMIFTLVFAAVIGFIVIINSRLTDIKNDQDVLIMKDLASNIKSEIALAASVNNNYLRRFSIPSRLEGREYKIALTTDELSIKMLEGGITVNDYFTILPVPVKGGFIENIDINSTEHCITKNDFDGIRIARTQASLDVDTSNMTLTESIVLKKGDEFGVFFSLNCVQDIRSARFTVRYNDSIFEIDKAKTEPITMDNNNKLNPLFPDLVTELFYEGKDLGESYSYLPFITDTRYTYSFIGSECSSGSGNIASMRFKVKNDAPAGKAEISFDDTFKGQEIVVLDCKTNKLTQDSVPTSRKNAVVWVE
jgi:hypothetical protein